MKSLAMVLRQRRGRVVVTLTGAASGNGHRRGFTETQ